jgi:hypothetical protein
VRGDDNRSAKRGGAYVPHVRTQNNDVWYFENVDDDPEPELVESAAYEDNWECQRRTRRVFDWDRVYYMLVVNENVRDQSMNCALADAQAAMWKYDYNMAASLYELTLQRYSTMTEAERSASPNTEAFAGYAQERLVLAYALAGRMPEATDLLAKMGEQGVPEKTIAAQFIRAEADGTNAFELCKTAYDYVQQFPNFDTHLNEYYRGLSALDYTSEEYYAESGYYSAPNPASAGCDIGQAAFDIVTAHPFMTRQPLPPTHLQPDNRCWVKFGH